MLNPGNDNKSENQLFIQWDYATISKDSLVKRKDVKIDYDSKHLKVQIKGQDKPVIDGESCKPINVGHF
jgi:hypothetical protein